MRVIPATPMIACLAILLAAALAPAGDEPQIIRLESVEYRDVPDGAFAAVVKDWENEREPFCAVIRSGADWEKAFSPAADADDKRPAAPDGKFFEKGMLVVVARTVPEPGEEDLPLAVRSFLSMPDGQELTYRYEPPAAKPGRQMTKVMLLLAVPKKYTGPFQIIEEREVAALP